MKHRKTMLRTLPALMLAVCLLFTLGGTAYASESSDSSEEPAAFESILETGSMFKKRDLNQTPDLSDAVYYTVSSGSDIHITTEGVYVLRGSAPEVTVFVEAGDEDKVQLVLDGVSIMNSDFPCIYVKNADKVIVTTSVDSSLSVTGKFSADGDTNTDGVIFSRDDLVLNGTARLKISSTDNGVVCKDDLKITGGTYDITAGAKCLEANDSIRISDGVITLTAGSDGLNAKNDENDALGYIYIGGGELTINAKDDAIHAVSVVQIDGGTITISASEGIEGTYVQINGGTIHIDSGDDGINAARQSSEYSPTVEINGGYTTIVMGSGDTDGIDCNGDIIVNGGTIDITGNSSFDYDSSGVLNGGTVIVNGQQLDYIPNQFGFGGFGGFGGRW